MNIIKHIKLNSNKPFTPRKKLVLVTATVVALIVLAKLVLNAVIIIKPYITTTPIDLSAPGAPKYVAQNCNDEFSLQYNKTHKERVDFGGVNDDQKKLLSDYYHIKPKLSHYLVLPDEEPFVGTVKIEAYDHLGSNAFYYKKAQAGDIEVIFEYYRKKKITVDVVYKPSNKCIINSALLSTVAKDMWSFNAK